MSINNKENIFHDFLAIINKNSEDNLKKDFVYIHKFVNLKRKYTNIGLFQNEFFAKSIKLNISFIYHKKLKNREENLNKIYDKYMYELNEAYWFPNIISTLDFVLLNKLMHIIVDCEDKVKRKKLLNEAILKYYTDNVIMKIVSSWKEYSVPDYQLRIIKEAIDNYKDKHSVTLIVLATQWESIIYNKTVDNSRRLAKKTVDNFTKLNKYNDGKNMIDIFFEKYIMYNCNSIDNVIEDVPGRHVVAHGFFTSYPSKKAALNAILFTDYLLKLKPIE